MKVLEVLMKVLLEVLLELFLDVLLKFCWSFARVSPEFRESKEGSKQESVGDACEWRRKVRSL